MVTLTVDTNVNIEKTHFKNWDDLNRFISSKKLLSETQENKLIGWNDDEIKEFERDIMIKDFNEMDENEKNVNWDDIFIKGTKYNS